MSGQQSALGVDIDPFSVSVKKWCVAAGDQADLVYRAIILDFVSRVKELTPVKTGYLRANWTVVRAGESLPVAGAVIDPAQALSDLHYGDGVIVVNPVVYARRIEFGFVGRDSLGRHYNEAGRGMLQQAIVELPSIAQEAAQRVVGDAPVGAPQ